MYWGNSSASGNADSLDVFDSATGFVGVWHLAEPGNAVAKDATKNHFDGLPSGMSASSAKAGAIGNARSFDASAGFIEVPNSSGSKLDFKTNAFYTVSAWVKAAALDSDGHAMVSKGHYQYTLNIDAYNTWELNDWQSGVGCDRVAAPAMAGEWVYVTGVRSGSAEYLYVNGALASNVITHVVVENSPRDSSSNLTMGKVFGSPSPGGYLFKGLIDEVRIAGLAESADWIKLCYLNQKADDALVIFTDAK